MAQAHLTITGPGGTRRAELDARGVVLGRDPACSVPLDDPLVSRHHARIFQDPFGRWIVEDLGSRNGVWVDGGRVRAHALAPGEKIEIGSSAIHLAHEGERQIDADPWLSAGLTVEVDPAVTQLSTAPRGQAIDEALSQARLRQLNRITESLESLASSAELYPAVCRILSDRAGSAAVVLRLPPAEETTGGAGESARPKVLSCGRDGSDHPDGPVDLHLSRRVLESVRSSGSAVLAGSFRHGRSGRDLALTQSDPDRPRAVCCAPIAQSGDGLDALYLDLPAEAAAPDLLEFTQAVARHVALVRRGLLLAEERADRKALDRQLELAREIQSKLTPPATSAWPGAEVAVHYQPAMWVGGDYCDVWPLEDGRLAFAVGDVSGKGLPAAMVMTNLQAALRTTLSFCRDPSEVMDRLSRHLETHLPEGLFVTMVLGLLDATSGRLECVNAGHILPVLRSPGGEARDLGRPRNPPLGVGGASYSAEQAHLGGGAALVVVTDGITETRSPAGEEFGVDRLRSVLAADGGGTGAPSGGRLLSAVTRATEDFRQSLPPHDDVTALVIVRR